MSRSPSKADLERDNDRLRHALADARNEYAEQIRQTTRTYEQRSKGTILYMLNGSYPALADLFAWLEKAHDAASHLHSPTGEGRAQGVPDPTGNHALGSSSDQYRLTLINQQLETVITWIRDRMGPGDRLDEKPPVCNNPDCPLAGWPQAFELDTCASCSDLFGAHRPRRYDLTRVISKTKPCWTRGCAMRGRIRQCEHSY